MIEVIRLTCTGIRHDGEWLRIKNGGYHLADVRSVKVLAGLGIDLADLSETELARYASNSRRKASRWCG